MLFENIRKGFSKTKHAFDEKLNSVFSSFVKIDESIVEELEEALILSDIGVTASQKICDSLRQRMKRERLEDKDSVIDALRDEMAKILEEDIVPMELEAVPSIILVVGVNGVGKTTSIGKMAKLYKDEGKKVLLVAADTFRAGAIEQLDIWAKRTDTDIYKAPEGSDPASVVFDGIKKAKDEAYDLIICDTAGRLHNKKNLMDELAKIKRIIDRELPDADKEILMVVDSTTGQNAVNQAQIFAENTDISGIILTKLDGTAKGGVIFSILEDMHLPVRYIGVGEQVDDFKQFDAREFVESII